MPDPLLTVSEWADQHRVLSAKGASEPGRWRTARTPFLRKIMDALSASSPVIRVIFMKGAQIGGTEAGSNWIGYVIDQAPGPMLSVMPTTEMAKRGSKQRIAPLIEETPALKAKVRPSRERDSGNTVQSKEFPGGILVMAGANSAAGLRSMPARYLFLDEIDAYPGDVDGEGDPIALAEARSRTFSRRKVLLVSTPTIAGRSRIEREYDAAETKWTFKVPCPHCGAFQELKFAQIRWENGDPRTARYVCIECGVLLGDEHKTEMLARGDWFTEDPIGSVSWGFHLSSLYSPVGWMSWVDIAQAWIAAQGDQDLLKAFINTVLGEVWREKADAPDWKRLYDRREEWPFGLCPAGVLFLTAGVDVQGDRIEVSVWGWGRGKQSWLVEHRIIPGDPAGTEVWRNLEDCLGGSWRHENGADLQIVRACIDSGHATMHVYDFVRGRGPWLAIDGRDGLQALVGVPSKVEKDRNGHALAAGVRLWPVGGGIAKAELYGWLKLEKPTAESGEPYPPGYVHLSTWLGEEHCKQLVAEALVAKKVKGFTRHEWQKLRERNEVLDCRTYARAAAAIVGIDRFSEADWRAYEQAIGVRAVKPPALQQTAPTNAPRAAPSQRPGGWMGDRRGGWMNR